MNSITKNGAFFYHVAIHVVDVGLDAAEFISTIRDPRLPFASNSLPLYSRCPCICRLWLQIVECIKIPKCQAVSYIFCCCSICRVAWEMPFVRYWLFMSGFPVCPYIESKLGFHLHILTLNCI